MSIPSPPLIRETENIAAETKYNLQMLSRNRKTADVEHNNHFPPGNATCPIPSSTARNIRLVPKPEADKQSSNQTCNACEFIARHALHRMQSSSVTLIESFFTALPLFQWLSIRSYLYAKAAVVHDIANAA